METNKKNLISAVTKITDPDNPDAEKYLAAALQAQDPYLTVISVVRLTVAQWSNTERDGIHDTVFHDITEEAMTALNRAAHQLIEACAQATTEILQDCRCYECQADNAKLN